MTQQSLWGAGGKVAQQASQHARKHGLTFLRVEWARGLFDAVEVAVFSTAAGVEVRRTAEMMQDAAG